MPRTTNLLFIGSAVLSLSAAAWSVGPEEEAFTKEAKKQSPSFQQKEWTGTQGAAETTVSYSYVGAASQNIGNGANERVNENYFDIRHQFMRHTLLAFLAQGGLEYEHIGFGSSNTAFMPDRLDSLTGILGLDARWSKKDLLHIQGRPGFYTDWRGSGWAAINTPLDIGYTRVVSDHFQWVVGFGYDTWRSSPFLGAAGFRWQMNNRWKLKAYLPNPDIEYTALPNLTLLFGADIRGGSYRVGPHFGDSKGHPELNSALVDYQEVRVGPGFSWNIRPLIELNVSAGYMVGRQFDFHNNGVVLNSGGSPYVMIQLHTLFKMAGQPLIIPQETHMSLHDILSYF